MPRPQFITCQLCGRGFGSASINIHIPQCYEKALKRWKVDPSGPRPVMPPLHGRTQKTGATVASSTREIEEQPRGGGVSAVRSLHSQNAQPFTEGAPTNMNLHPCAKCGRSFNFDRIAYHESVCKGDQKRRVFDSSKQRRATVEGDDGFGYSGGFGSSSVGKGGKKRQLGVSSTTSRYTPAPAPQTNWRQRHEEFINAIRSAKRADTESQSMWGTSNAGASSGRGPTAPSKGSQRDPYTRSINPGGSLGGGGGMSTRGMPQPTQRIPALMTKQSESRKQNIASGGRAAQAKSSVPLGPPQGRATRLPHRASQQQRSSFGGGAGDRFGGRGPGMGGGGAGRVLNDNTSSVGMLQAFGQA